MQPTRVLIVEDERIIVLDLTDRLRRFGCDVIGSCATADEALEFARAENPDLVLMDIMLSGERDGIEAATQLRNELGTPVVFLTAFSDDEVLERAKQAEPYGFIIKPFKERELYSVIELATYKAQMEKQIRSHERLLGSILNTIGEAVLSVATDHTVRFANPAAGELLASDPDALTGKPLEDLIETYSEENNAPVSLLPQQSPESRLNHQGGLYFVNNVYMTGRHGSEVLLSGSVSVVRNTAGGVTGYTIALRDVSDLRRMTETISYQVSHDSLTRLLNRDEFITRIAREFSLPGDFREHESPFYLYADLDNFKVVNDVCGHAAGDQLLREIAADIAAAFGDYQLRARIGDDEFGVFIPNATLEQAQEYGNTLYDTICRRFDWRDHTFPITTSVAIVPVATENADPFSVLAAADDACYMLKDRGGNGTQLYHRTDDKFLKRRGDMHWTSLLSRAIDEARFVLYYQSIVRISDNTEEHREILMRLVDEDGSLVSPGRFIPAAEMYNLMPAIDRLILLKVARYISEHDRDGTVIYCVNISGSSLLDTSLTDYILELFSTYRIDPSRFLFEITETAAIQNFNTAVALIEGLRSQGCSFALDDFGNGFSSFAYLKNLPVDILKIDGSFVQHVAYSSADKAMVEAINSIGHVLGMETIAEFVKDEATLQTLREMHVDFAQGFLLAEPEPLEAAGPHAAMVH